MTLSVDRHAQSLIHKVRDYYFSERLYLMRSIKHLMSYWQEQNHPYMVSRSQYRAISFEEKGDET